MTEAPAPLAATIDQFEVARGHDVDSTWAFAVSWSLLRRDVEPAVIREGLLEALDLVTQSQESPQELFGNPGDHADELILRWRSEGRPVTTSRPTVAWRDVPSSALAISAWVAVALLVVMLLGGETTRTWTVGTLLLPVGMGFGSAVGLATWGTQSARRPVAPAAGVTALAVVAIALVTAGLVGVTADRPIATGGTWWLLVVAAASGTLARALRRVPDATPQAEVAPVRDDEEWSKRLEGILRGRLGLAERRVHDMVAEAQAHAAEVGRSVQEEFGLPEEYAARFAPDVARKSRLLAGFFALLAVSSAVQLVGGFAWPTAVLTVLFTWQAVSELRRHR